MGSKRRIKVAFDEVSSSREEKRQRKMMVAMDLDATIEDLAQEIRETLHYGDEKMILAVDGEFELRGKDGLSMIQDNETVHVVLDRSTSIITRDTAENENSQSGGVTQLPILSTSSQTDEPIRNEVVVAEIEGTGYQVRFISAELARQHAKATLKEITEPTNGLLAFNGQFISGNTSLRALQQEAGRLLEWSRDKPEPMDAEEDACQHSHNFACSCSVALFVEQSSLFSTLHCRLSINGDPCGNSACPYSHTKLDETSATPPHCSICEEALGFPCPTCITQAKSQEVQFGNHVLCPLVQNAGCLHIHHAHCLGTRHDSTIKPCPSGCPLLKFQREATILDAPAGSRFLVIVWDGDRIDRIPVPDDALTPIDIPDDANYVRVGTETMVKLVESFLEDCGFKLPGLSLRVHAREPVRESTRFTQSTLVSVCSTASHQYQGYKRFDLFSDLGILDDKSIKEPLKGKNTDSRVFVDLHTSSGPIIACGCTRLNQIVPRKEGSSNQPITLYAVRREAQEGGRAGLLSKQNIYLSDPSWQPATPQSSRGMAALLSSLYLLAHVLSHKDAPARNRVLSVLHAICRFPPAVRALGILFLNQSPQHADRAALSESLFHCLKDFAVNAPEAIVSDNSRLFETSRIFLGHLLTAVDPKLGSSSAASASDLKPLQEMSLICTVSRRRLTNPVKMNGAVVNDTLRNLYEPGRELYKPTTQSLPGSAFEQLDPEESQRLHIALAQFGASPADTMVLLDVAQLGPPPPSVSLSLESAGRNFAVAIKIANKTDLVTRGPLELKSTAIVAPQVVLDSEGLLAVFTGRGCGSTRDVNFFRPMNDGDTAVDVNDVAHSLQSVIQQRITEDTWQIDSYEGVSVVSNRAPDEAIVLCLDLSESMNKASGIDRSHGRFDTDDVYDYRAEAEKLVIEYTEGIDDETILDSAKSYLKAQHRICLRFWKSNIMMSVVS